MLMAWACQGIATAMTRVDEAARQSCSTGVGVVFR